LCFDGFNFEVYRRVHSRPPKLPHSEEAEAEYEGKKVIKEKEVSESFLSYLSSKGPFEDWKKHKEDFQSVHVSFC
jgi:hypothetical protein